MSTQKDANQRKEVNMQETIKRILCWPVNWFVGDENYFQNSPQGLFGMYLFVYGWFLILGVGVFLNSCTLVLGVLHVLNNDWVRGISCFCCVILGGFFLWVVYKIKAGVRSQCRIRNIISNDGSPGGDNSSGKNPPQIPAQFIMGNCLRVSSESKGRKLGETIILGQLGIGLWLFFCGPNTWLLLLSVLVSFFGTVFLAQQMSKVPEQNEWIIITLVKLTLCLAIHLLLTVSGGSVICR